MYELEKIRERCFNGLERDVIYWTKVINEQKQKGEDISFSTVFLKDATFKKMNFEQYFETKLKKDIVELVDAIEFAIKENIGDIKAFNERTAKKIAYISKDDNGFFGPLGVSYSDPLINDFIDYCVSVKGHIAAEKKEEFIGAIMKYYGYEYSSSEKGRSL